MKTSTFTSGWRWNSKTVRRVLLMISLTTSCSLYAGDAGAPDMALLEFIGESVPVGNELVDPVDLQAMQETPFGQFAGSTATGSDKDAQQTQTEQQTGKRKSGDE